MKISKLFHWLYGILMLLPCFAILVKCVYVAFNKNAYESYSGTSTQYVQKTLQTNEVNSVDDLVVGNVYSLIAYENTIVRSVNYPDVDLYFDFYYLDSTFSIGTNATKYIRITYTWNNLSTSANIFDNGTTGIYGPNAFIYKGNLNSNLIIGSDNLTYLQVVSCPYTLTYFDEIEVSTLDNVFYHAVDEVCNNELFAWASNSFLNAPLTYITNLFNMPSDSALILLMSYWFNISIIWLVFDVMIYVPLLVHRWLDKGIVE